MLIKIGRNWVNPDAVKGVVEYEDYSEILLQGDTGIIIDKKTIDEVAEVINKSSSKQSYGGEDEPSLV